MRFDFDDTGDYILVKHGSHHVLFDNASSRKTRCLPGNHIFDEVNDFIAQTFNEEQQASLYEVYREIEDHLTTPGDFSSMTNYVAMVVGAIYTYVKYEDVKSYVARLGLPTPDGMLYRHESTDPNPDRTYVVDDYRELMILVFALRFMTPVWSAYLRKAIEVVGTIHKEFEAFRLISQSWPYTTPAMVRLRQYIAASIGGSKFDVGRSGLSSTEIPDWLLAGAVVRRIAPGQLNCQRDGKSVISAIYAFLTQKKQQKGGPSGTKPINKENRSSRSDDEKDVSTIDMYRSRVRHTIGEVSAVAVELKDIRRACMKIDPSIPDQLISMYIDNPVDYRANSISRFHLTICQWVLGLIVPMEIVDDIHREDLLNGLMVTRIVLQHWGFYTIEGILSSESYTPFIRDDEYDNDQPNYGRVSANDSKALRDEAPICRPMGRHIIKMVNIAEEMITEVIKLVSPQVWITRFPTGANLPPECATSGRMPSPRALKTDLIHLYLKVVRFN